MSQDLMLNNLAVNNFIIDLILSQQHQRLLQQQQQQQQQLPVQQQQPQQLDFFNNLETNSEELPVCLTKTNFSGSNNSSTPTTTTTNTNTNNFISQAHHQPLNVAANGLGLRTQNQQFDNQLGIFDLLNPFLLRPDLQSQLQQQQLPAHHNHHHNNLINANTSVNHLSLHNHHSPAPNHHAATYKAQQPSTPSSTLLAKLSSVTSRPPSLHSGSSASAKQLDPKVVDLLEAFHKINDNPEPAAIEMIAKRINVNASTIANWFDTKRLKLNPKATINCADALRGPPAKKRAGGRVVTFSEYQRSLLEAIFDENNYLHPQEYEELSNLIQVPSRNIKIWFKNRRSKQRLSDRITTPSSTNNSD